ncbi:CaiB/BaiF CoA transferase family protein [Novosphingobium pentaromativorans]|uniref:L-carnitine dehydratase/bile acid-inducible protein F n=1 Tax=Novosphingobium pentaromativorans US6-1 TaxID=1088721 RepID=G6ECH7_9SPHN|nr:CoA transferase [Novosphingobium pentaromativorans]AIT80051.1 formyl-CoA transferase [Novosphingobium pentaromativorans US6-1]EHJ60888.1 L-carnitine dehydratase/bile acid-inducible protein F [Novosphingobium pentaromativorans US6-1]
MLETVLKNIRVLDFGRFIAAPWCGAILADMGADVIRVEKKSGGEDRFVQPVSTTGDGATFLQCNRNKRSVTLDTTTEAGREILRDLVKGADVVLVNMPDAALEANGLDYEALKAIKPDIVFANATGFGRGGPYSKRVAFDGIGQVMSGGVFRSGTPDQPMRSVVPYVDFGTAMALTIGIAMALYHRAATGRGQAVEASLLPVALMMTDGMIIDQAINQQNRGRVGNAGTAAAPCDLFKVTDGWILVQIAGQPMFKRWCRLVDALDWFEDPRFADDDRRAANGKVLNARMQAWCADMSLEEATARLEEARIPVGPLFSPQDVLDDPHIAQMGFLNQMEYPGLPRPAPVIETPFRLSETPGSLYRRAPLLGEHTEEVLAELGISGEQLARLREEQII